MRTDDILMGGEYAYAQTKAMAALAPLRVRVIRFSIDPDLPDGRADRWFNTVDELTQALGEEPIVAMEQGKADGIATVALDSDTGRWARVGGRPLVIVAAARNIRRAWDDESTQS